MKEYTVKQIAELTGVNPKAVAYTLGVAKVKYVIHKEISPRLRFYCLEDLPKKYRDSIASGQPCPKHMPTFTDTAELPGPDEAKLSENTETLEETPEAEESETAPEAETKMDENTDGPIDDLDERAEYFALERLCLVTPKLIKTLEYLFGPGETRAILENNYGLRPYKEEAC